MLHKELKKQGITAKIVDAAKDLSIGMNGGRRRTLVCINQRKRSAKVRANKVTYLTT